MNSRLRIIITGLVGLYPIGGVAWDYLQYLIGLARLGHDVYYYEDTWSWPYHPLEQTYTSSANHSIKFIREFFQKYAPELNDRWYYLHLHKTGFGMKQQEFDEIAKTADLFLNVSGACDFPDYLSPRCMRVFLDTDPAYNQIMLSERFSWSENVERWCANVMAHDQHFTYAENIDAEDCLIPKMNLNWKTTRFPVVNNLWAQVARVTPSEDAPWTTVMTWNAFKGKVVYKGVEYKSKDCEFEKIIELPHYTKSSLKVAIGGINVPLTRLADYGWDVVDAPSATLTPQQYQDFIAQSRGEFSIAKHIYVATHSGWFSCRSACYLAAGRPVVVQDTGFSSVLPVGEGLMSFTTLTQAAEAIQEVEGNYDRHCKAARVMAEEFFESDKILQQFIEDVFSNET